MNLFSECVMFYCTDVHIIEAVRPSLYIFSWFRVPSLEWVTQTYVPFVVFWIRPAWSSLEQGKKLQHFLLDRVAKFTSFVSLTGSGFRWVRRTPLPKFLLSTPLGLHMPQEALMFSPPHPSSLPQAFPDFVSGVWALMHSVAKMASCVWWIMIVTSLCCG